MIGIRMSAFFDELEKVALSAADKNPNNPWSPKTVGAPRAKLPNTAFPKAPTAPGPMSPSLVMPADKYGPRETYSQPNVAPAALTNPTVGEAARTQPPPTV